VRGLSRATCKVMRDCGDEQGNFGGTAIYFTVGRAVEGYELIAATAGHPPLLVFTQGNVIMVPRDQSKASTFILDPNLSDDLSNLNEDYVTVYEGDLIVAYTDGVSEAADADGNYFGSSGIRKAVESVRDGSPSQVAAAIEARLGAHVSGPIQDDYSIAV